MVVIGKETNAFLASLAKKRKIPIETVRFIFLGYAGKMIFCGAFRQGPYILEKFRKDAKYILDNALVSVVDEFDLTVTP